MRAQAIQPPRSARIAWSIGLALAVTLPAACSDQTISVPSETGTLVDAGGDTSAVSEPCVVGQGCAIDRADGTRARGELVQIYDFSVHIVPDQAHDEQVYALFDPQNFSERRAQDRSFVFVSSKVAVAFARYALPASQQRYRDFVRAKNLVLGQLPLAGVAYIAEDGTTYHKEEGGCGDFAWDVARADAQGNQHCLGHEGGCTGGKSNHDYYAWDQTLLMPHDGTVEIVYDQFPDDPPRSFSNTQANHLSIRAKGGFYFEMHHLKRGSALVQNGQHVKAGTPLAKIGNSGFSYGPHLHLTLFWLRGGLLEPDCSCGWSVPTVFRSLYVSDTHSGGELREFVAPKRGQWVSNEPF